MSAVQDATRQRQREARGGISRSWRWPLFDEPFSLIGYVTCVFACYLAFTGWEATRTPLTSGERDPVRRADVLRRDLRRGDQAARSAHRGLAGPAVRVVAPGGAVAAAAVRAGRAVAVLGLLIYLRVRRAAVYRRAFSSAALGLAGACASALFRLLTPVTPEGQAADLADLSGAELVAAAPAAGGGGGRLRRRLRRAEHLPGGGRRLARRPGRPAGRHALGPRADAARPDRDLRGHPGHDRLRAQRAAAHDRTAAGGPAAAQPAPRTAQGAGAHRSQDRRAERGRLAG